MKRISEDQIREVLKKLKRNEMRALYFTTALEAKKSILRMIPKNTKVGVGGSVTLREMGLVEDLLKRGNEVYDHWKEGIISFFPTECKFFCRTDNLHTISGIKYFI